MMDWDSIKLMQQYARDRGAIGRPWPSQHKVLDASQLHPVLEEHYPGAGIRLTCTGIEDDSPGIIRSWGASSEIGVLMAGRFIGWLDKRNVARALNDDPAALMMVLAEVDALLRERDIADRPIAQYTDYAESDQDIGARLRAPEPPTVVDIKIDTPTKTEWWADRCGLCQSEGKVRVLRALWRKGSMSGSLISTALCASCRSLLRSAANQDEL